ncbi:Translation initiation factor IF-3 [Spatholobus suberectus]|nr:Translation initiation factor IF-3 [Spatholobus suberectus]
MSVPKSKKGLATENTRTPRDYAINTLIEIVSLFSLSAKRTPTSVTVTLTVEVMAFWHRIRNPNLKALCIQFRGCYIQPPHAFAPKPCPMDIPHPYSVFHDRPASAFNTVRFFAAPIQFQVKPKNEEQEDYSGLRLNEKIKAPYVRLVRDDGHSIVPRFKALERAKELKLDLVEVDRNANPPVCKIMDFHKEMYKRQEREKERAKSKAEMTLRKDTKEVRFSEKTEAKDLKNKADMVKKLMEKGYRVKCKVSGKENQDLTVLFSPLLALIEDVCIVESGPHMAKKDAYMIVRHIKYGLSKKGGKKLQDAAHVKTQEGNMETSTANSSDSIEDESHAESGFEMEEEVLSDGDKLSKSSWSAFSNNVNMTASPNYQTNAAPETAFMSRSNDPVSPPVSENRYRRTNHHGENKVQSNAQVPPAVTENRYKRVEPRNRFQQTSNNTGMNYQGPGTSDAARSTSLNWNRTRHVPVNVNANPRIEGNKQAFTPPGSRHLMPSHENIPKYPPNVPNTPRPGYGNFSAPNEGIPKHPGAPNTPRSSSYDNFSAPNEGIPKHPGAPNTRRPSSSGIFSTPKGPETQGEHAGMHGNREGNQ